MKYVIALLLCLFSMVAHAGEENKYTNEIWIYTHDYVYFFQSCWTVVDHPDYLGNYCYGEFYSWGQPSPSPNVNNVSTQVVILAPDESSDAYFVDKTGECYLFNKIHHEDAATETDWDEYFIQCGDYIFNNGFEDHSGDPPGE